ncbi:T9SS type A sorting domain-containing protein, partial [bacterium]|nr:T9SS type A sorting domain-containing protein [bacterium]
GVAVTGDYALVADVGTGLLSIRISDPTVPVYVGGCAVADGGYDVVVDGDHAYVTLGFWGLQIFDIADPTTPAPLDDIETDGWSYGLAVDGDYTYVADHGGGFVVLEHKHRRFDLVNNSVSSQVIDDSDIDIISARLTTVQTDYIAWNLSADGGMHWDLIVADGSVHEFAYPGTLLMWRTAHYYSSGQVNPGCTWMSIEYFKDEAGIDDDLPVSLALRQNAPNPFNSGTTVRYDIPQDGLTARIEVFDVSGKRVRVLIDGPQTAGARSVSWDGRDERGLAVASGVYYCRMTAPGYEKAIKMTLLK